MSIIGCLAEFPPTSYQDPWWIWVAVLGGVAGIALLIAGLGRLLRRAGVGTHERSTRAGAAVLQLQSIFDPSKRHIIEAKRRERRESDGQRDSGDDESE
jgi:hypothetical protein